MTTSPFPEAAKKPENAEISATAAYKIGDEGRETVVEEMSLMSESLFEVGVEVVGGLYDLIKSTPMSVNFRQKVYVRHDEQYESALTSPTKLTP